MSSSMSNGQSCATGAEEPYKVGKGKPPIETRFKKGNKAGKGRLKGAKNIKTIVNEVLSSKVRAKVNGKLVTVTNTEYIVMQLASQARSGELKAIDKALALRERYEQQEDPSGPPPEEIERDLETLRDFLNRHDMCAAADKAQDND